MADKLVDGRLAHVRRVDRKSQRNSLAINDQLQLRSLAFSGQTHRHPVGGRKGGIHETLFQVHPPFIDQVADDGRKYLPKGVRLLHALR